MNELSQALIGESAHAAPARIIAGLTEQQAHQSLPGSPHTIYQELWHMAFWQKMSLGWISRVETPYPDKPSDAFPSAAQSAAEPWEQLCRRFIEDLKTAATIAEDKTRLSTTVSCPSRPGEPVRLMTVQDQLLSWAAHNAYHFGRIVLSRQLLGAWPPPGGGFSW